MVLLSGTVILGWGGGLGRWDRDFTASGFPSPQAKPPVASPSWVSRGVAVKDMPWHPAAPVQMLALRMLAQGAKASYKRRVITPTLPGCWVDNSVPRGCYHLSEW